MSVEKQVIIIFAGNNGFLDDIEVGKCRAFETALYRHLDTSHGALLAKLQEKKQIDDEIKAALLKAIGEAKESFKAGAGRAA